MTNNIYACITCQNQFQAQVEGDNHPLYCPYCSSAVQPIATILQFQEETHEIPYVPGPLDPKELFEVVNEVHRKIVAREEKPITYQGVPLKTVPTMDWFSSDPENTGHVVSDSLSLPGDDLK